MLVLIDEVLKSSNTDNVQQIDHAWSLQLQRTKQQCENIAGPLLGVSQILSNSDQHDQRKDLYLLGGGVTSILLMGAGIGLLAVVSALGLTLFVSNKNYICTQTSSELAIKMKELLDSFDLTEEILRNPTHLQSIQTSIEIQLQNLQN